MLHALGMLFLCALISAIVGALIGFIFKERVVTGLTVTTVVITVAFVAIGWKGSLERVNWSSFQDSYAAIEEIVGPFVYFFLLPSALVAFLVGRWRRQRIAALSQAKQTRVVLKLRTF